MAKEHSGDIRQHHSQSRTGRNGDDIMEPSAQSDGRNLGLVPHLHEKEGNQRRQEGAEPSRLLLIFIELVRDQRPRGHRDKGSCNGIAEPLPIQD